MLNYYPQLYNLLSKGEDSDLVHFFENGTKLKMSSKIKSPFKHIVKNYLKLGTTSKAVVSCYQKCAGSFYGIIGYLITPYKTFS